MNLVKIDVSQVIKQASKLPLVKINRSEFLEKELKKYCTESEIRKAIETTPRKAGISKDTIDKVAEECIKYETNKVTGLSAIAGIPGGMAMLGTIPADLAQYFGHIIRIAQKLGYIYGWKEINSIEDDFDSESSNTLLIFMGIMFGIEGASGMVSKLASQMAAANAGKIIVKGLSKNVVFKAIQNILKQIGIKINQKIVGQLISKSLPLVGGAISGGITYFSYKPMCYKLKEALSKCPQAE